MADLEITIGADPSEFESGLKKAQKSTDDFEKGIKKTGLTGKESFALLATGLNATIEIIGKLASAMKAPLEAFRQAEVATNKLRLALENQGLPVDKLSDSYSQLAKDLQNKTGIDDDAIKSNLALLQSMIGQQEISQELAQTLVDLGERTGSMEQAATILGKAINGNVTALNKMGVEVEKTGTRSERTKEIIQKLSPVVGGLAEAGNKGLGGVRGLESAFSDFLEGVGEQLAPVISDIIVELKRLTESLGKSETIKSFFAILGSIVREFIRAIQYVDFLIAGIDRLKSKLSSVLPSFLKFTGGAVPSAGAAAPDAAAQQARDAKRAAAAKIAADQRQAVIVNEQNQELAGREEFNNTILEKNAEYQALTAEQKKEFDAENREALEKAFQDTQEAQDEAIKAQLKAQIDANNKFLAEQKKYGAAYAQINQLIYSDQVKGAKQATGELTQLQQSNNSTLKAIGKAAAITQITIKTAESAMNIFAGFSAIPFIGIPLGIAAAGAAIAFGAEQIAGVVSAQKGGLVPGVTRGSDSVPMIAEPGELVVPRANFSEVVNAVASQRAGASAEASSGVGTAAGGSGVTEVVTRLEFSGDNAEKFLTARQVEARKLGLLREARA